MKVFNMADQVEAFLDEFRTFLSRLPHAYEQLRLNQFTQALEIAVLCVLFFFFSDGHSYTPNDGRSAQW